MATRKPTKSVKKVAKKNTKAKVKPPVKPSKPRVKKSAVVEEPVHVAYDEEQIPEDIEEELAGEPLELDDTVYDDPESDL